MTKQKNLSVAIRKCNTTVDVERDKLPAHVQEFIFAYGIRQILNDAHSQEKDPKLALALVEKKLEALYAGTVKQGRQVANPFDAWLQAQLINVVIAAQGGTKAKTKEMLTSIGTPMEQLEALYGTEAEAALGKFTTAWKKEQAEKAALADALGKITLPGKAAAE